jgi:hypothetical protein
MGSGGPIDYSVFDCTPNACSGLSRVRTELFPLLKAARKLGFIDYDAGSGLQVHSSLLNIVLHD